MPFTDQEYPRGYGTGGILCYIVLAPDTHPVFVDGFEEHSYRIASWGMPPTEADVVVLGHKQMALSANMLAQAAQYQRKHHATF